MEVTKAIYIDPNSLGFEVGENPRWRGEFTLEQIAEFDIKPGKPLNIHLLEMEETFATVEFGESEKTTVPIVKVPEGSARFAPEPSGETDTPDFSDTLRG
ncbi:MAG TPA: hypothetical protein VIL74_12645 [Pyrinomonadaceae bacterium]|jgi:hypothetical protein